MNVLNATGTIYFLNIETFVVYELHSNVHLFKCELHMYTCKVFDASFTLNSYNLHDDQITCAIVTQGYRYVWDSKITAVPEFRGLHDH